MGAYGRYVIRHLPELIGLAIAVWIQFHFAYWATRTEIGRRSRYLRIGVWCMAFLFAAACVIAVGSYFPGARRFGPLSPVLQWFRGVALGWALASLFAYVAMLMCRRVPEFSPERRGFIRAAGAVAVAAPFGVVGYGTFIQRTAFRVNEVEVPVANLAPDLNGLRIAHLSDIHLSPFLSEQELARAIGLANETKPHVAVVTGDLITSEGDPLHACLRQLARLRPEAPTLGCLGNHEIYARCEDEAERAGRRLGLQFLRRANRVLRFGNAVLNVAGVDWQRGPRMLAGAEKLLIPNAMNLMLCHNPNGFDPAVKQGWDLTLSGHTHGGQLALELADQRLNVARFFTNYVYGLYRNGSKSVYVTRGIGTVGLPARLGAPPEVALIRLCATSS